VAARNGCLAVVAVLVQEFGADVNLFVGNYSSHTPMSCACLSGHVDVVLYLLERKALVGSVQGNIHQPLVIAAQHCHTHIVRVLLAARADVGVTEIIRGDSALTACVRNGDADCTFVLVENKADLEHTTSDTLDTPLALAAGLRFSKIMQILVDHGADPNAEVGGGECPLYSVSSRYEGVLRMDTVFALLCSGARQSAVCDARIDPEGPDAEALQGLGARMFDVLYYLRVMRFVESVDAELRGTLSRDVVVDRRVGRGANGVYHEPLERILAYAGLEYTGSVFNKWMDVVVDAEGEQKSARVYHKRVLYRRWRVYMRWSSRWRAQLRREAEVAGQDPERAELSGGVGACAAPQAIDLQNQAVRTYYGYATIGKVV
jgi:hypothetical protein